MNNYTLSFIIALSIGCHCTNIESADIQPAVIIAPAPQRMRTAYRHAMQYCQTECKNCCVQCYTECNDLCSKSDRARCAMKCMAGSCIAVVCSPCLLLGLLCGNPLYPGSRITPG